MPLHWLALKALGTPCFRAWSRLVGPGTAVSKHESYFADGPWLVVVHPCGSEDKTWRRVDGVHPRKISTKEESFVLEGGCQSERRARAAWTENQVDCLVVGAPRAGDVFPASHQRETVFEGVIYQERATLSRSALDDAYFRVSWHSAVLIVWLDNPWSLCIRVYGGVHAAVVLHGCSQGLKLCLSQVYHCHKRQAVRPGGIGQRAA